MNSNSEEHELENNTAERRHLKRERIEISTPNKGEVDETKTPGSVPVAKKGRVQDGTAENSEDDIDEKVISTPPPPNLRPSGLESPSAPPTPYVLDKSALIAKLESKLENPETQNIRQRVEALDCEDGNSTEAQGAGSVVMADTEIIDVEGESLGNEAEKDVELADVAAEVAESASVVDKTLDEDSEIADVAAEVSETAKSLATSDEKDMEVAEVAAEVAQSAELLGKQDAIANDVEFVDAVKPVVEPIIAEPIVPSKPVIVNSFSSFSSSASPFSSVPISNKSPFASVASASPPAAAPLLPSPPLEIEKPKPTSFAVPFVPINSNQATPILSRTTVSTGDSASIPATPLFGSASSTILSGLKAPPTTPATPLTRPPNAFASQPTAASPFAAFASASGFGKASSSTSFNSFATPSSSKLGTTSNFGTPSGGSGFGSYGSSNVIAASAFGSVATTESSTGENSSESDRKLGEPVEIDASRRIFTEQEVVTGEEDEDTLHSVRCKLFAMATTGWVERGTGVMKMNATKLSEEKTGIPRLVMRADATHRLLLNATLFSEFSISVSQEKYVCFTLIENSEPTSYMLRLSGAPAALAFVTAVQERIDRLK